MLFPLESQVLRLQPLALFPLEYRLLARFQTIPPQTRLASLESLGAPWSTKGHRCIQGKFDLAKDQLTTIEKLCGKGCEYYQDLSETLEQAHAL